MVYYMKKISKLLLIALSILSISIMLAGCGLLTADDITGEYVSIKMDRSKKHQINITI